MSECNIRPNDVLEAPFWPGPVRVLTVRQLGSCVQIEAVVARTQQFYSCILALVDLDQVHVVSATARKFSGNAEAFSPGHGGPSHPGCLSVIGIVHTLLSAYRHLAKADEHGLRWLDLGLPTVGAKPSLAHQVCEYLRNEDVLLAKIASRRILERALQEDEQLAPSQLEIGATILRESVVPTGSATASLIEAGVETPSEQEIRKAEGTPSQAEADRVRAVRAYSLKAVIPWDKLSDFVRGVVTPFDKTAPSLT